MKPDRLNAFTDGVVAIIITIMVLEMRVPEGTGLAALRPALPIFGAYVLSFIYVGIYWNNHHHMMQTARRVDGRVLWSNLHLLFWLSLFPFVIRWVDERGVTSFPVAAFGFVLLMAAIAYLILEKALIHAEGEGSGVAQAVGSKTKEWVSALAYASGIAAAFWLSPLLSIALYVAVAAMWLIPDRRFERRLQG
ncbi:MAG TPA: TMEM175 family protein [Sphingomicrobium sp.]|nr:TMEM175 family protein [Sphingomicrobium sp.]